MKRIVIIQARTKSSRFPRKILKNLPTGETVLQFLVERLGRSQKADEIVVATTENADDDVIAQICNQLGVACFRGSENDVLERYRDCARAHDAGLIARITSDCPLVDPEMLDLMFQQVEGENLDYLCNQDPPTLPDGLDIDIFSRRLLDHAADNATSRYDREHVTPFMKNVAGFKVGKFLSQGDFSDLRITLDTPSDLDRICAVLTQRTEGSELGYREVIQILLDLRGLESSEKEPADIPASRGGKLYETAKRIIPGGNSLLSKRPEMFLPGEWPNYFDRALGITVWDLDGNTLKDMSIMGIGTNTLGYANERVDEAVITAIRSSNMSTLNPPEEVFLADRLLELHPWFDMARFARTGGEANAMALRISRVASGRTKVAVCGYHGWHDWYLALNTSDSSKLDDHLLPGLSAKGVPHFLGAEVSSFRYNNFEEMRDALADPEVGVVFMEVMRSEVPLPGFLEEIRSLTQKNGQVLIFDECTSGFRETFGGLHIKFGVQPDVAVFGKALGNGYAITAILGVESVMKCAETTFMSSTFWSERIGFAAGVATLDEMERQKSWEILGPLGERMKSVWKSALAPIQEILGIRISGIDALSAFSGTSPNFQAFKTLVVQEMLLRNSTLASNIFYPSTAHYDSDIDEFGDQLAKIVSNSKDEIENGEIEKLLLGPVSHSGFSRLN